MDFLSNITTSSTGPDIFQSTSIPALASILNPRSIQSPLKLSLTTLAAALFSFFVSVLWRPRVHKQSPAFTSDTIPFFGSFGYIVRGWSFWQGATVESKTGNFSFWLGKIHVIGMSGPAARKLFYDHPDLELVSGATLVPFGPHFMLPVPLIFRDGYHTGRNSSFFLRRMTALLKTERLVQHFPDLIRDTHDDIAALLTDNPSGVVYPPAVWRTVIKHNCRLFFTDEIVEDPEQWQQLLGLMDTSLHAASIFNVAFPWLPAPSYIKRRLTRYGLQRLTAKVINKRMKSDAPCRDDALQMLLDNSDRKEFMVEFLFSAVFISSANAQAVAPQLLNVLAIHNDWQEKIYAEVKQAAKTHSKGKHATLVEQLDMMPLSAWESGFPSLDLCLKEVLRMWLSISATRRNIGNDPIPIPGSNEVIPPMTFVVYNTTETHFCDKLYPDPTKFDPERYLPGREEFKQESYSYLSWGYGQKPCPGSRWAKVQQAMIVAYALAMYKWSSCDKDGKPDLYARHRKVLDTENAFNLPPAYCRLEPREVV